MQIQFADKTVTYDRFLLDVADAVVRLMDLRKNGEFICQNEAFRRFGRANVERWRREGKVEVFVRPKKIEYRLEELLRMQSKSQDYF
jgi:hypothetical protein